MDSDEEVPVIALLIKKKKYTEKQQLPQPRGSGLCIEHFFRMGAPAVDGSAARERRCVNELTIRDDVDVKVDGISLFVHAEEVTGGDLSIVPVLAFRPPLRLCGWSLYLAFEPTSIIKFPK
ncbi:hypothetical protein EVAR_75379_1 [Eumeta japonica]|uniref:Uncharacterized protein n=1 Tax=Eumeta variegata TaxID=151549 RepID=A0A4C1YDP1_EUMVA|nr:hypothetical protein EVAR_75379_1 [Eumeta japonica]